MAWAIPGLRKKIIFSLLILLFFPQQNLVVSPQLLTAQVKHDPGNPFPEIPDILKAFQPPVGCQKCILNQIQRLLLTFRHCFRMKIDQTVSLTVNGLKCLLISLLRLL